MRTLLVVPDSQRRRAIELDLSVRGQTVVCCEEASSALAAFNDNVFRLVLIDSQLPDDGASRFCRSIRSLPGGDEVTIAVVSRAPSDEERRVMLDAGSDEYVACSTDGEPLSACLASAERRAWSRLQSGQSSDPGSSERFLVLNPNGSIRHAAPVAERLLGFPPEAIVSVNAFSFFHPDDAPQLLSIVAESFAEPRPTRAIEVRVRRDGDAWRTIAVSAHNRMTDPDTRGIVFELRGPEARIESSDQVTRGVMHDPVTDLPNRTLFTDRVDHAVDRSARRQQPVVVMAIDVDNFATETDPVGAECDDGLVIAVAQRLRSCLRSSDTAARLGHDQFAVLLEEIAGIENVGLVADRIVRAMSVPFFSAGTELTLTAHIGIAVSSVDRHRAVDLLRDANIARAWARVQGSGSHAMFDPSMQPPDDEPTTSEYATPPAALVATSDHRLAELSQRIASLEQMIARLAPVQE